MTKNTKQDDSSMDRLDLEAGLEAAFDREASSPSADDHSVLAQLADDGRDLIPVLLKDLESDNTDLTPVVRPGKNKLRGRQGRYQVLGEIARGGVGVVFRGHDIDLGRDVAMKVIREEHQDSPEVIQRFVEEAQIGGQLQHPGIVPVYEIGLGKNKRPFFTMKLIKGKTLSALLSKRKSPREKRRRMLSIFESVCQTMGYAHARGVIHRDLKPSNVMVGAFGEVLVVDWGMGKVLRSGGVADEREAKRKAEQTIVTTLRSEGSGSESVIGSVLGTPRYMSPEQARGDIENVDERSDVFGLGAVLCEILTGSPPYNGEANEVFTQASMARLDDAIERIEGSGADQEIIDITRRCLAPAPQARFQHAGELAKAVGDYMGAAEEKAQQARLAAARAEEHAIAANTIARQEKKARRLTLALATAAVVLVAVGSGFWLQRSKARAAALAETARRVNAALERADLLASQAESSHGLAVWALAWKAAQDASVQLEKGEATEELRARVATTLQRIEPTARAAKEARERLQAGKRMLVEENIEGALEEYRRVVEILPGYTDGYLAMGSVYRFENRTREALEASRKAVACRETPNTMRHLARALRSHGDREAAIALGKRTVEKFPNIAELFNSYAILLPDDRWPEQLVAYRQCLSLDPLNANATPNLVRLYMRAVERGEERILRGDLLPPEGRWRLDIAQFCAGKRHADAARFYELAFQAKPSLKESLTYGANYRMVAAANALVASGKVSGDQRAQLHAEALAWFEEHVTAWAEAVDDGRHELPNLIRGMTRHHQMPHWALRRAESLGLTPEKREAFRALATKLDKTLARATLKAIRDPGLNRLAELLPVQTIANLGSALATEKHHEQALEFFELWLRLDPGTTKLPIDMYNAACCALVVARDKKTAAQRGVELRAKGLDWLRRSLKGHIRGLRNERTRASSKENLEWWANDPDLASIRGDAIAKLPADEQAAWKTLWKFWTRALGKPGR